MWYNQTMTKKKDRKKTAIIDVGGGMRGIYAAGVFDRCLENDTKFDLCIGISAGSANLSSFLAGQKGRNYVFYTQYAMRKDYMGFRNFLRNRNFINLDYVCDYLCNSDGEYPLDYAALVSNPAEFTVIATNAETGEPKYFTKDDMSQDNYGILKASCSLPVVNQPFVIDGVPYFDGALSDPVPVERAFAEGCDKVVLVLTKPRDFLRRSVVELKAADRIEKKYPLAAAGLRKRIDKFNASLELAIEYESEGRLMIVAPDDICGVSILGKDKANLDRLYAKGLADGDAVAEFIRN